MKVLLSILIFLLPFSSHNDKTKLNIKEMGLQLEAELSVASHASNELMIDLYKQMKISEITFNKTEDINEKLSALSEIRYLENSIEIEELNADLIFIKLRFKKGIELIKMMYEKTLALDHHFTTLKTFKNISELANPHSYPGFENTSSVIKQRMNKKDIIKLPSILESNPFVSLTTTVISSLFGDGKKEEKEADLEKISCILDFTVKMNTDLNIIFYETEFLKQSNLNLKADAETLFREYNSAIEYLTPLTECRDKDDWDNLYEKLNDMIVYLEKTVETSDAYTRKKIIKKINNLEFSIDRLLTFIDRYMNFIIEGEQYYTKFKTILNNYNNEEFCLDQLPHQYIDLKEDVDISIHKFNEAYSITELKGSKLRDLLYGMPQ